MRILAVFLLWTAGTQATEMKVARGLPYAQPAGERRKLDLYYPAQGKGHPVVLWIHGGGWKKGDRSRVQDKPQAFVDQGCVFVSTNYRFVPEVTVRDQAADIARALRWVHDHAEKYGGDPRTIFVMGHSAGAHLSALVCTDLRYLAAEKLSPSILKGCVPVDTAVYDIRKQLDTVGPLRAGVYSGAFGKDDKVLRELSPMTHVAKGKSIPPFLILHVADRPDSKLQSHLFADRLKAAGVPVEVVAAAGTTHATINSNLGKTGDEPTRRVWEFLARARKR